jgi:O-antigen biosynthesis protein
MVSRSEIEAREPVATARNEGEKIAPLQREIAEVEYDQTALAARLAERKAALAGQLAESDTAHAALAAMKTDLVEAQAAKRAFQTKLTEMATRIERYEWHAHHLSDLDNDRETTIRDLNQRIVALGDRLTQQSEELRSVRERLGRVLTSTSWVVSSPVRWAGALRRGGMAGVFGAVARIAWWSVTLQLRMRLREKRLVRLLYATGAFDAAYYARTYPDVVASGLDPALHYWRIGADEERDPSAMFSSAIYRSRHAELPPSENPLLHAILTGQIADGSIHRAHMPDVMPVTGAATTRSRPRISLPDLSTLTFHESDEPVVTTIVDGRTMAPAVEQTLRMLSANKETVTGELIVLVAPHSEVALPGVRRIVVGPGPAITHLGAILSRTRAPAAVLIDSTTAIEETTVSAGLAALAVSNDIAIVCALRRTEAGTAVDAGLSLDPDGSIHPRCAGLPAEHFELGSVMPVDAFSPGLFVLDKSAWLAAGGIDVTFKDSAYAAVDLSMRLRAAGRRVVCEPKMQAQVLVEHPDPRPAANDDDDLTCVLERWSSTIEHAKRHPQPRVLFVDHFTPTPDQDAGSNVIWWYMRIFIDLGYRVTFLPVMDLAASSYTANLRRHGIECVSMPGATTPEQYVRDNAAAFQLVLLYRAPIAYYYTDAFRRAAPNARIVFNTVDLHFLREEREATLTDSAARLERARETKRIELAAIRKADCTIVLSKAENEILDSLVPHTYRQCIPLAQPVPGCGAPFFDRKDVAFIGNFAHPPNVDAMQYFTKEIWPRVRARLTDARLLIVGSGVTDAVRVLEDDTAGIEIRGFVPDLAGLLRTCRLTVAPLRYGAGMKGKVVNSLAHGVPCVATTIAVEGMGLVVGRDILVADGPEPSAEAVVSAYADEALWTRLSANGVVFAEENFSIGQVTIKLQEMLRTLHLPT